MRTVGTMLFGVFLFWTMPAAALTASQLLASCETLAHVERPAQRRHSVSVERWTFLLGLHSSVF